MKSGELLASCTVGETFTFITSSLTSGKSKKKKKNLGGKQKFA